MKGTRTCSDSIKGDSTSVHVTSVGGIVHAKQREEKGAHNNSHKLATNSKKSTEDVLVGRETEDISMYKLPPVVSLVWIKRSANVRIGREGDENHSSSLRTIFNFVSLGISRVVTAEHAHDDDGKEASEEDDENKGVHDGQPMDLEVLAEEVELIVLAPVLELHVRVDPLGGVGELDLLVSVGELHGCKVGGGVDPDYL